MQKAQERISTQKRINRPSDDPVGTARVLTFRTSNARFEQFKKSADLATTYLNYTDTALGELTDVVSRAKELAIQQSNTAGYGDDARQAVAEELQQLHSRAVNVGNRKLGERFIFSGYQTVNAPFDAQGNYSGDNGKIYYEIDDKHYVPVNIPGSEIFSGLDENGIRTGSDLFRVLQDFGESLRTNDIRGIQASLDSLDELQTRVIQSRAKIGAVARDTEMTREVLEQKTGKGRNCSKVRIGYNQEVIAANPDGLCVIVKLS
jgi:flagellin-like hook-associated protein FlgL